MAEEHWMWMHQFRTEATTINMPVWDGSAVLTNTPNFHRGPSWVDLDIKSMRKAPEPCELRLELNTGTFVGSASAHRLSGIVRILVKE